MPHFLSPPDGQPDLFAGTAEELTAEIDRHGGGAPPRYPVSPVDANEETHPDFSPVQIAERHRAYERDFGVARIRRVSLDRLAELLL